ncbi:imm11 family protein [Algibacter pectinivorans]|uniref:Immunity MXAN-0049 protein domain-containing protein n=1 Tax=Algibacter pectinivorans TaxID=870482 RepID=A0A1I1P0I4_9FLAO|nr:DUF1629 domain-containing protein [Algibacter pectinivorans]SFD03176.1 hypothetical protein SAMN04487987_10361 [Algibacter pectinivorans]
MKYKILADSKSLYEFADQKTSQAVMDALIINGKETTYNFNKILYIQNQKNIEGNIISTIETPVLTVGGKLFISQSLKNIFEKYDVIGEYFEAQVKANGTAFNEDYFLFNPLTGSNCLDYKNSTYNKIYDDWSKIFNISKITHLKIEEHKTPNNAPLFFLGQFPYKENDNRILEKIIFIREDLAKEIKDAKILGVNIFEIENYSYNWKWL